MRLVLVILVGGRWLSSRYEVGAFRPTVREVLYILPAWLVLVIPERGMCLVSRCSVGACHPICEVGDMFF